MALHRTQVLLEPEQHRALTQIARARRRSLSEVIRELVQRELDRERDEQRAIWERRMAIIKDARAYWERAIAEHGPRPTIDLVAALEAARAERDERILGDSTPARG